uniref:Uncharacterized protein n=1 Tax=Alexandrium monilatum TaxID=311494 RepID=A0A7S4QXV3_9DINO
MSGKLVLVLAASSFAPASGQFLKPTVVKSFSSSWTSSSSWVPGHDGQMHQQVHEVRTETLRDHGMPVKHTESETACRDGLCQHTMSVQKPGSIMVMTQQASRRSWAESVQLPARLRAMMQGFSFPMVYVEERRKPVNLKFLAPHPPPVLVQPNDVGEGPRRSPATSLAALAGAGISLAALIAATIAKCQHGGSRELPLRTLGEPLAPAQEAAATKQRKRGKKSRRSAPAAPEEGEAAADGPPVAAYLQNVYSRAVIAADAAAAKTYMYRVYERASA